MTDSRVVLGLSVVLLSLAGAPLLIKTTAGFARRPPAQIAALLRGAHGDAARVEAPREGLDEIARSLNAGEVERAMICALRLRLPELSWDAAAPGQIIRWDTDLDGKYLSEK